MNDVVADTHAIVWALADPPQLSGPAAAALGTAQASGRILVSTITFVELTYLTEKGKIDPALLVALRAAVRDPADPIEALPLSLDVAQAVELVPRATVPDMPDRIIAATALAHGLPLVSADRKIRSLSLPGLTVVW